MILDAIEKHINSSLTSKDIEVLRQNKSVIRVFKEEPLINEYLERPGEVLSMFSEAFRILDRNTAELMVDRMKDEMEALQVQNDELTGEIDELKEQKDELSWKNNELLGKNNELSVKNNELQAEVEKLKKLLAEQNK
jgi:chromosome segregation ATPase